MSYSSGAEPWPWCNAHFRGKNTIISISDSNGFAGTHLPSFTRGFARRVMTLVRDQNALVGTVGSGGDREGASCKQAWPPSRSRSTWGYLKWQPVHKSARKQDLGEKVRMLHSNMAFYAEFYTGIETNATLLSRLYSAIIILKPRCMLLIPVRIDITNHSAAARWGRAGCMEIMKHVPCVPFTRRSWSVLPAGLTGYPILSQVWQLHSELIFSEQIVLHYVAQNVIEQIKENFSI